MAELGTLCFVQMFFQQVYLLIIFNEWFVYTFTSVTGLCFTYGNSRQVESESPLEDKYCKCPTPSSVKINNNVCYYVNG